jgi:hypothetical protein
MSRAQSASSRLLVTVVLAAVVALGAAGCVLVPAPYPVAGYAVGPPVVVAPRPYVVAPGPYYRYGHGGYYRWR